MSTTRQISYSYTDRQSTNPITVTLPRVDYSQDYRCLADEPGEVVLTNTTADLGHDTKYRFAVQDVNNVYSGAGIEVGLQSAAKKGKSLLCQVNETWTVTDTKDATLNVAIPVSAHLVVKVPNESALTEGHVLYLIGRLIGGLYSSTTDKQAGTSRVWEMLRGVLRSSEV